MIWDVFWNCEEPLVNGKTGIKAGKKRLPTANQMIYSMNSFWKLNTKYVPRMYLVLLKYILTKFWHRIHRPFTSNWQSLHNSSYIYSIQFRGVFMCTFLHLLAYRLIKSQTFISRVFTFFSFKVWATDLKLKKNCTTWLLILENELLFLSFRKCVCHISTKSETLFICAKFTFKCECLNSRKNPHNKHCIVCD